MPLKTVYFKEILLKKADCRHLRPGIDPIAAKRFRKLAPDARGSYVIACKALLGFELRKTGPARR
jgi:hypothetical protein